MLPEATRESVIAAIEHFDKEVRLSQEWQDWEHQESHKYAIEYQGRRYPVKKIVSLATDTPVSAFSGGAEANGWIEKHGFKIVELRSAAQEDSSFQVLFEGILSQYVNARAETFGSSHPIWQHFVALEKSIESLPALQRRPTLHVRWSVGKGNWAKVPWIAIIDSREADAPTGGLYCVFLFREDMTGVYVTLNQGVTKPREELGAPEARVYLRNRAADIRKFVSEVREREFFLNNEIDLRSAGLGQDYQDSTIAHKLYETGAVPPDGVIQADLELLLDAYERSLEPTSKGKSAWIFQANPKLYDVATAAA